MRRNSRVTGECRSVNRQLETAISGSLFFVGIRRLFVRCFLVSRDASVVAVEDQLCVRGLGLSSFSEVILVSSRFCLCIDDAV